MIGDGIAFYEDDLEIDALRVLGEIEELVGSRAYARFERGWRAKAREDLDSLKCAIAKLRHRLKDTRKGEVLNPGGWLHSRYHKLRDGGDAGESEVEL